MLVSRSQVQWVIKSTSNSNISHDMIMLRRFFGSRTTPVAVGGRQTNSSQHRNKRMGMACSMAAVSVATWYSSSNNTSYHETVTQSRPRQDATMMYHQVFPALTFASLNNKNVRTSCEAVPKNNDASGASDEAVQQIAVQGVGSNGGHVPWWRRWGGLFGRREPRLLTPKDPVFTILRRQLRQRQRDEIALRALGTEAMAARDSRDPERIRRVFETMTQLAYGKGVTPQMREDFLMRHGCAAWTDDLLDVLVDLGMQHGGFCEMGAGNGQWARALHDHYQTIVNNENPQNKKNQNIISSKFEFVMAHDDMSELPLSPKVYHQHTQPAHSYFYSRVRKCDNHVQTVQKWESRGRALLLVYPSPGPMAMETLEAYAQYATRPVLVYVGEGRGGANANDAFFDYLLEGGWTLVKTMSVTPSPGNKGFEKVFILERSPNNKQEAHSITSEAVLQ
eukprot:scaffold52073_cov51-Attheya_sp.AAC.5